MVRIMKIVKPNQVSESKKKSNYQKKKIGLKKHKESRSMNGR